MDNLYLQYVHNLKGSSFDSLKPNSKQAVMALLRDNFNSYNDLQKAIINESSVEVMNYISKNLNLKTNFKNIVFSTDKTSYTDDVDFNSIQSIVNFKKINSLRFINEHFRSVNKLLPFEGLYIGRAEIYSQRKAKMLKKFGKVFGNALWFFDFVINRVLLKQHFIDKAFHLFKNHINRPISQAELLGRLVYCGFKIISFQVVDNIFYFSAKKIKEPSTFRPSSSNPLIRLQRVGKGGKMIGVYKFRTMHAYSEYLQDLVIEMYGYNDKGKPANDFRVTEWGMMFRKLWVDELPQFINVLKGEMKLVGIRPLSKVRFNEFPTDLQEKRIKFKPGCFPPYVALCMPDEDGNIEAERIYLNDKAKNPYFTDVKYLYKSVYNIVFNKIRSA